MEQEGKKEPGFNFIFCREPFLCILRPVLFKTAVSSLLLNWVLFLTNSSPSQSRARGNRRDRLQSLQSNTWEIIDWASVKLVFFLLSLSLSLSLRLHNGDKEHRHKKKDQDPSQTRHCIDGLRSQIALPQSGPRECENG